MENVWNVKESGKWCACAWVFVSFLFISDGCTTRHPRYMHLYCLCVCARDTTWRMRYTSLAWNIHRWYTRRPQYINSHLLACRHDSIVDLHVCVCARECGNLKNVFARTHHTIRLTKTSARTRALLSHLSLSDRVSMFRDIIQLRRLFGKRDQRQKINSAYRIFCLCTNVQMRVSVHLNLNNLFERKKIIISSIYHQSSSWSTVSPL